MEVNLNSAFCQYTISLIRHTLSEEAKRQICKAYNKNKDDWWNEFSFWWLPNKKWDEQFIQMTELACGIIRKE
jgi:hypothetical protein